MRAQAADLALLALRRARDARERDSRLGLYEVRALSRKRAEEAIAAATRLAQEPEFVGGTVLAFQTKAARGAALAMARREAEGSAASSQSVTDEATRRWQQDHQNLRVVDLLLERRAAERAAEHDRREARELDDLAAQGWLRAQATAEDGLGEGS